MKTRSGFEISLIIKRADGTIEDLGVVHNVLSSFGYRSPPAMDNVGGAAVQVVATTHTTPVKVTLAGTFSQSGSVITRASGSFDMTTIANGNMLRFGTGENAIKLSSGSASTANVSRTQTVGATTLDHYQWSLADASVQQTAAGTQAHTRSYTAPILTWTNGGYTFPVHSGASYTLARITYRWTNPGGGSAAGSHFDLPASVTVNAGDQVLVTSSIMKATWNFYQPQAFAVSPISGYTGTGRIARLLKASEEEGTFNARLYLVTDANKLTPLPDMPGPSGSYTTVASLTILETIVPSLATTTTGADSNNYIGGINVGGVVVTGGTVKQIFLGNTTNMYWVIEYDTPITVSPGDVIQLNPRYEKAPVF